LSVGDFQMYSTGPEPEECLHHSKLLILRGQRKVSVPRFNCAGFLLRTSNDCSPLWKAGVSKLQEPMAAPMEQ
jgi:hypothetical protein